MGAQQRPRGPAPRRTGRLTMAPVSQATLGGQALVTPLLDRLQGVKPSGPNRWTALCPAHADRSPSLAIKDAGDRILIHCFTGCAADDVLSALGLAWRDLYPDRWHCAAVRPNEAAQRWAKRRDQEVDPLDIEREILRLAAADVRAGKVLSIEDAARVEVARLRILATQETAQ